MEDKKKKFPLFAVIVIIVGVVLIFTGAIIIAVSGDKYSLTVGETETIEENFDAREIEKLDFDLGIGKFTIKAGDTDKIKVFGTNVPKDRFELEVNGDTFKVKTTEKKWYKNIDLSFGRKGEDTVFEITVPDKEYNKIDFDCGVGEVILEGLDTKDLDLDGGVGTIDMKECNVGYTVIDAGVGEITFSGKLLGDLDLDMGVGAVTFDIDGYKDDYHINANGNVKINSDERGSGENEKHKIDVDSGVGEVKLNFK